MQPWARDRSRLSGATSWVSSGTANEGFPLSKRRGGRMGAQDHKAAAWPPWDEGGRVAGCVEGRWSKSCGLAGTQARTLSPSLRGRRSSELSRLRLRQAKAAVAWSWPQVSRSGELLPLAAGILDVSERLGLEPVFPGQGSRGGTGQGCDPRALQLHPGTAAGRHGGPLRRGQGVDVSGATHPWGAHAASGT